VAATRLIAATYPPIPSESADLGSGDVDPGLTEADDVLECARMYGFDLRVNLVTTLLR